MTPRVKELLDGFAVSLAQVFESMAEQLPDVSCEAAVDSVEGEDILWWKQPLQIGAEMLIWAGARQETWLHAGNLTLRAAGLDSVEESEARNTWLEILGQALASLARAIGGVLGRETTCEGGAEGEPGGGVEEWTPVRIAFGATQLPPLYIGFSPALAEAIGRPQTSPVAQDFQDSPPAEPGTPERSRTMNLLLDIDLPVSISFGKTQLLMRDVIKLTTGSIVELDRGVSEPVDVLVNGSLVARGEVVVVEGNYGVRILEIASRLDRMKTLR